MRMGREMLPRIGGEIGESQLFTSWSEVVRRLLAA